jgi:prephenate dehydrogenase
MPLWIDPQTHDAWAAFTSHLPFLMANALAYITPQETRPLIGPGFRSTTRLAGSSLAMMTGILTTNRENVLASLSRLQDHLAVLETCLQDEDWLELMSYLAAGAERRAAVIE